MRDGFPALSIAALEHLRRADPVLCEIINRVGEYRIEFREPSFENLVRSIVFQQLSGRVARVIFDRLAAAAGGKLTPQNILKLRRSFGAENRLHPGLGAAHPGRQDRL